MSDGATEMLEDEELMKEIFSNSTPGKVIHVTERQLQMLNARGRQVGGDHYKSMGVEPWDVIATWPIEQQIGYYRGNILKYTMRMGMKDNPVQEIAKVEHYAQKLQEVLAST